MATLLFTCIFLPFVLCVGEGKVLLTLSHWEYVCPLAYVQFSCLRKAEGMVRHFLHYCSVAAPPPQCVISEVEF